MPWPRWRSRSPRRPWSSPPDGSPPSSSSASAASAWPAAPELAETQRALVTHASWDSGHGLRFLANLWQMALRAEVDDALCLVVHSISYSNPAELHERLSMLADAASDIARPSR